MALQDDGSVTQRLGCAERAVKRKLDVIRETWIQGES
jgi:hypothetical protein